MKSLPHTTTFLDVEYISDRFDEKKKNQSKSNFD